MYLENAKGCSRCENMWKALKEKDMEMANLLREEIKLHIGEGKFEYCGECFAKAPKKQFQTINPPHIYEEDLFMIIGQTKP